MCVLLRYVWRLPTVCFEKSQTLTGSPAVWPSSLTEISSSDGSANTTYSFPQISAFQNQSF